MFFRADYIYVYMLYGSFYGIFAKFDVYVILLLFFEFCDFLFHKKDWIQQTRGRHR